MSSENISADPAAPQQAADADATPAFRWGVWAWCVALVLATFVLVTSGGLVTSTNSGMSVPDWPTSFGKWLFIPVHIWADLAVMLEHNHRLKGAVSGLIAIGVVIMAARGFGLKDKRTWLAGLILFLYIVQGLLGGFRVTEMSIFLAILHGIQGQLIFALVVVLATLCGPRWARRRITTSSSEKASGPVRLARAVGIVFLVLLVGQLVMGAVIRHTNSASAIPDAPLVYGGVVPPLEQSQINEQFYAYGGDKWTVFVEEPMLPMEAVNEQETPDLLNRVERVPAGPPTLPLLLNHYARRLGGMAVLPLALGLLLWSIARAYPGLTGPASMLKAPAFWLLMLFLVQVMLGLSVIWSRENAGIATGHQAVGAALLGVTVWLITRVYGAGEPVFVAEHNAVAQGGSTGDTSVEQLSMPGSRNRAGAGGAA